MDKTTKKRLLIESVETKTTYYQIYARTCDGNYIVKKSNGSVLEVSGKKPHEPLKLLSRSIKDYCDGDLIEINRETKALKDHDIEDVFFKSYKK